MTVLYRQFSKSGILLYVGISASPLSRQYKHNATAAWFKRVTTITLERFACKADALRAEQVAIKEEKPRHNYKYTVEERRINAALGAQRHLSRISSEAMRK